MTDNNGFADSILGLTAPINLMLAGEFIEDEQGNLEDLAGAEIKDGKDKEPSISGLEQLTRDFSSPMSDAQMADFMARIEAIKNLSPKEFADWDAAVVKGAKLGLIIPPPGYVPMFAEPVNNSIVKIEDEEPTDEDLARIERAMARSRERREAKRNR